MKRPGKPLVQQTWLSVRDCISWVVWEPPGVSQKELEYISVEKDSWLFIPLPPRTQLHTSSRRMDVDGIQTTIKTRTILIPLRLSSTVKNGFFKLFFPPKNQRNTPDNWTYAESNITLVWRLKLGSDLQVDPRLYMAEKDNAQCVAMTQPKSECEPNWA